MNSVLDALYPKYCCVCNRHGSYLCDICMKRFKRNLPECYICRKLSPQYMTHDQCKNFNSMNSVFVAWEYNALSSKILKLFKYKNVQDIAGEISILLSGSLMNSCYNPILKNTLLVPVPTSSMRRIERGFNQTELIARYLSKRLNSDLSTDILASKNTNRHQARQTRDARLSDMSNPFYIKNRFDIEKYKSITIIDDVITTGRTLENICNVLRKEYGYRTKVNAICLFRGSPYYI